MKTTTPTTAIAACTFEITTAGKRVQLLPAGQFRSTDSRPVDCDAWVMNDRAAGRILAALGSRQRRIVIDYEHQTLHTRQNGHPAPAAGWFNGARMEWDAQRGLFALDVEWTERAAAMIAAREYRYISPVFAYDKKTGEILALFHAALTNDPGLDGMESVTLAAEHFYNPTHQPPENKMNEELLKLLRQLLGLADDASEADVEQALQKAAAAMPENAASLTALIDGLTARDTQIAALKTAAAAQAQKNDTNPDPAKFVPIQVVTDMQKQLAALTGRLDGGEVDALVKSGLTEGKLLPSMEKWARELGAQDVAQLRSYLDAAAPVAALTSQQSGGQPPADNKLGLNATELEVARLSGLTPEEFAAAKTEMKK